MKQTSDDPDVGEYEELEDEVDIDEMLAEEFAVSSSLQVLALFNNNPFFKLENLSTR